MTVTNSQDYSAWIGHELTDSAGNKIGKISQVYLDDQTGQPTWVTVSTGLFGNKSSFVPIQGTTADGDRLVAAWDKDKVKGAPQVADDGDSYLSPQEEQQLYSYYGQDYTSGGRVTDTQSSGEIRGAGHDTSGPDTDDAMTRSEEQVRVGTTTEESGRARLRKYVVTEQVQTTVPVSHEEVRVEREPITDANRDAAMGGADISEEEHEVVLHEERPVVQKEVVAKERVRLGTETVTENRSVTEEVRKEQIDTDGVQEVRNER
jgi:uncharacterized protein (TIGR02271 family)